MFHQIWTCGQLDWEMANDALIRELIRAAQFESMTLAEWNADGECTY
jgi:hypothetical protein